MNTHDQTVLDQFSWQAIPFSQIPEHHAGVELLVRLSEVRKTDAVLDVACGPGIVAAGFAPFAREVTGIDFTPAMIEQARKRQAEEEHKNLSWQVGSAYALPFPDGYFDVVLSRYAFHHMERPLEVLREMRRVCKPGGRVLVCDLCVESRCSERFDRLEQWRDASHVHALSYEDWGAVWAADPWERMIKASYGVPARLNRHLEVSLAAPEAKEAFRQMIRQSVIEDDLGVKATAREGDIEFTYPIGVFAANRPLA